VFRSDLIPTWASFYGPEPVPAEASATSWRPRPPARTHLQYQDAQDKAARAFGCDQSSSSPTAPRPPQDGGASIAPPRYRLHCRPQLATIASLRHGAVGPRSRSIFEAFPIRRFDVLRGGRRTSSMRSDLKADNRRPWSRWSPHQLLRSNGIRIYNTRGDGGVPRDQPDLLFLWDKPCSALRAYVAVPAARSRQIVAAPPTRAWMSRSEVV